MIPGWYACTGKGIDRLETLLNGKKLRTVGREPVGRILGTGTVVDVQIALAPDKGPHRRLAPEVAAWPGAASLPILKRSGCGAAKSHIFRFDERPLQSLHAPVMLERISAIYKALGRAYENHAAWDRDPFETLVSCILSLRTQDPVTDAASKRLFSMIRRPEDFADANPARIEKLIYPVGMYRRKAVQLVEISRRILERFDGTVPSGTEELLTLPGVGRKTANLVRSFAFHLPAVCVDTHVHRISNRWGLVRTTWPEETESELRRVLPRRHWMATNAFLVQHGQALCRPIGPRCDKCFLKGLCMYKALMRERDMLARIPDSPKHPSLNFGRNP